VDLTGAVVTADAAHAGRETAGERKADYLLTKGNTQGLQRAITLQAFSRDRTRMLDVIPL
jgi:hypothetical protein